MGRLECELPLSAGDMFGLGMFLSQYSVGLQLRMILEMTAPSLWCRRSVTNIVLRFLMALKALKATTASSRLRLGVLSLGRGLENFSAHSRTNQEEPYFGGPGQISGFLACLPSSANSSARSFRRQPVWLFTLTSVTPHFPTFPTEFPTFPTEFPT